MARRFFAETETDDTGSPVLRFNRPRPIVGAAQRLNLSKFGEKLDKRPPQDWQIAAWRFFENIGEIHYAFNLIGQVVSRVRLFPAVVAAPNEVPVHVDTWLESLGDKGNTDRSRGVVDKAKELMDDLTENTPGRTSGMMRTMAMNFGVPGEVYLAQDPKKKEWLVLSSEELTSQASSWRVRRSRAGRSQSGTMLADLILPADAWVARMWRTHPRWGDEPDSSMLGVLDQCEQLVLLDQAMRNMARRAMNAGVVFIPNGITAYSDNADETVADALAQSALQAVESEAALSTVTPKVLTGPPELGALIKFIPLTQPTDPNLATAAQKLLERILQGIDIPKDVVKGLADVKFANVIVIDDDLYRAHIEPLILLIVDTLTAVYLQPQLTKGLSEADVKIADRLVVWADTSTIVTGRTSRRPRTKAGTASCCPVRRGAGRVGSRRRMRPTRRNWCNGWRWNGLRSHRRWAPSWCRPSTRTSSTRPRRPAPRSPASRTTSRRSCKARPGSRRRSRRRWNGAVARSRADRSLLAGICHRNADRIRLLTA